MTATNNPLETELTSEQLQAKFLAAYTENLSRLKFLAKRYLKTNEEVEELLQEVFIQGSLNFEKNFKGNSSIYTWLYVITRNSAINAAQKASRVRNATLSYDDYDDGADEEGGSTTTWLDSLYQDEADPVAVIESRQSAAVLQEAFNDLARFNPRANEVFQRIVVEGVPLKTVAEQYGLTQSCCRGAVYQARRFLFKRLKELHPERDYTKILRPRSAREGLIDEDDES